MVRKKQYVVENWLTIFYRLNKSKHLMLIWYLLLNAFYPIRQWLCLTFWPSCSTFNKRTIFGSFTIFVHVQCISLFQVELNRSLACSGQIFTYWVIVFEYLQKNMKQIDVSKEESKKLALRLKMAKEKLIKFEELTERQEVHVSE